MIPLLSNIATCNFLVVNAMPNLAIQFSLIFLINHKFLSQIVNWDALLESTLTVFPYCDKDHGFGDPPQAMAGCLLTVYPSVNEHLVETISMVETLGDKGGKERNWPSYPHEANGQ